MTRPDARASSGSIPARSPLPANVRAPPVTHGTPSRCSTTPTTEGTSTRRVEAWSTVRSAAAASRCRASSSAAATSAASARRRRSSARARPRRRRMRSWTPPGMPASRPSTPRTPTAAAAARSFIGSWLRAKGPEVRDRIVLTTKTFNPMAEGDDQRPLPRADPPPDRRSLERLGVDARTSLPRARHGSGRRRIAETIGTFDELVRRGQDPGLRRQQRRRRLARGSTPVTADPGLGAELLLAARPRGRGAGVSDLRPRRARLHAVQPACRRLADREVPPGRGAAARLADDAAARAVPPFPGRSRLRRARGVRGARSRAKNVPGRARHRLAARRPERDGRRRRPAQARPPAPGARSARARSLARRSGRS